MFDIVRLFWWTVVRCYGTIPKHFDSINRLRKGRTYVAIGIQLLILGHYKLLNLSKMQNLILVTTVLQLYDR